MGWFYVKLFVKCYFPLFETSESLVHKNKQKVKNFAKIQPVLQCRPKICAYENRHCYQCIVHICKFVWMLCVEN